MSWRTIQLGEGIHIRHGFAFKGEFFAASGEYMVLTPGNFLEKGGFRVREGKERFYHSDFPEDYLLAENNLIVAMTEQGEGLLGSAARIPGEGKYLHNQRLGLVEIIAPDVFDKQFLYWVLNNPTVRAQIRATATGAKVRHTAPERIKKVLVSVPDVRDQRAIALVLDSYDDLIATNQRRIQLLEEAARRLYREWFVHLRFPGHEPVKVKDGVPEEWGFSCLGGLIEFKKGKKPIQIESELLDGYLPHLLMDVMRGGQETEFVPSEGIVASQDDDTIMVMDGSSSGETFIGFVGAIGSTLGRYRVKDGQDLSPYWLYLTFNSRIADMRGSARGAAIPHANKDAINQMEVLVPPNSISLKFDEIMRSIFNQIVVLRRSSVTTAQARDLLLPKLMSGQLDVSGITLPEEVAA